MGRYRHSVLIGLVITVSLVLLAAPIRAQDKPLTTVKVATVPIASMLPFFTALDKGFFTEAGLRIQVEYMTSGAHIIPALMGGSVDIGFINALSHLLAVAQGFDLKGVQNVIHETCVPDDKAPRGQRGTNTLFTGRDSPITNARGLEGRTLALVAVKSVDWLIVVEWLEKNGADPAKVKFVEMPFPGMGGALSAGQVDAVEVTEPFTTIIKGEHGRVLGYTHCEVKPGAMIAYWAATSGWIKAHPDLLERFVRAYRRGLDHVLAHPEDRIATIARHTRITAGLAERMLWGNWKKTMDLADLQWWADQALKRKLLPRRIEVRDIVHTTAY